MNRKARWIVIACVAILGIGASAYSTFLRGYSSQDCAPVVAMLEFNHQQTELIGSTEAQGSSSDGLYQQWADGLAQRAQQVNNPALAVQAIDLADLASTFVAKLPQLNAVADSQGPGAPTPRIKSEMDVLNTQILNTLAGLSDACG
ncbi:MAG: hypothetical protein ACSLE6_01865 [Mycobacterium sp.]